MSAATLIIALLISINTSLKCYQGSTSSGNAQKLSTTYTFLNSITLCTGFSWQSNNKKISTWGFLTKDQCEQTKNQYAQYNVLNNNQYKQCVYCCSTDNCNKEECSLSTTKTSLKCFVGSTVVGSLVTKYVKTCPDNGEYDKCMIVKTNSETKKGIEWSCSTKSMCDKATNTPKNCFICCSTDNCNKQECSISTKKTSLKCFVGRHFGSLLTKVVKTCPYNVEDGRCMVVKTNSQTRNGQNVEWSCSTKSMCDKATNTPKNCFMCCSTDNCNKKECSISTKKTSLKCFVGQTNVSRVCPTMSDRCLVQSQKVGNKIKISQSCSTKELCDKNKIIYDKQNCQRCCTTDNCNEKCPLSQKYLVFAFAIIVLIYI